MGLHLEVDGVLKLLINVRQNRYIISLSVYSLRNCLVSISVYVFSCLSNQLSVYFSLSLPVVSSCLPVEFPPTAVTREARERRKTVTLR